MKKIKEILSKLPRKEQMEKRAAIGKALWPQSAPLAQDINLGNLIKGRTKKIDPEDIRTICAILGVSPNVLLEWE